MNVDLGIWSKLTKIVVALVVIAILLLIGMCYLPLIQTNERYRERILKLETQLQIEAGKSKQLQAQIDALTHDPKTVERLSREKLGYAKPVKQSSDLNNRPPILPDEASSAYKA